MSTPSVDEDHQDIDGEPLAGNDIKELEDQKMQEAAHTTPLGKDGNLDVRKVRPGRGLGLNSKVQAPPGP